jgi:short-subunit dehydrogenase
MSTNMPAEGSDEQPFAVVTGASTGIGYELARCCAENGFDLLIGDARVLELVAQGERKRIDKRRPPAVA